MSDVPSFWFGGPIVIPAVVRRVIEQIVGSTRKTLMLHFHMPSLLETGPEWDQEIKALFAAHPDVKYMHISCVDDHGNCGRGWVNRCLHVCKPLRFWDISCH